MGIYTLRTSWWVLYTLWYTQVGIIHPMVHPGGYSTPCAHGGYSTPCAHGGYVLPTTLGGVLLPTTLGGIPLPTMLLPIHPWVYLQHAVPGAISAASPGHIVVQDDDALGSEREIPLGEEESEG